MVTMSDLQQLSSTVQPLSRGVDRFLLCKRSVIYHQIYSACSCLLDSATAAVPRSMTYPRKYQSTYSAAGPWHGTCVYILSVQQIHTYTKTD